MPVCFACFVSSNQSVATIWIIPISQMRSQHDLGAAVLFPPAAMYNPMFLFAFQTEIHGQLLSQLRELKALKDDKVLSAAEHEQQKQIIIQDPVFRKPIKLISD